MKTQGFMFHFSPVLLTDSSDCINQEIDAQVLSYYGFVLKPCFEMFVFLFQRNIYRSRNVLDNPKGSGKWARIIQSKKIGGVTELKNVQKSVHS